MTFSAQARRSRTPISFKVFWYGALTCLGSTKPCSAERMNQGLDLASTKARAFLNHSETYKSWAFAAWDCFWPTHETKWYADITPPFARQNTRNQLLSQTAYLGS